MRHVLLILLIALLPFRGWMGDAMAMAQVAPAAAHTMAGSPALAEVQQAASQPSARSTAAMIAALHPCAEHSGHALAAPGEPLTAAAAADTQEHPPEAHPDASPDPQQHHHQHKTCDVCNGPAMALGSLAGGGLIQPHGVLVSSSVRFASTVLPRGIKPPIS